MGVDEVVPGRIPPRRIAGSEQLMEDHKAITVHAGHRMRGYPTAALPVATPGQLIERVSGRFFRPERQVNCMPGGGTRKRRGRRSRPLR